MLANLDHLSQGRLCLDAPPHSPVCTGEIVERNRKGRVIAPDQLFRDRKRLFQRRFGFFSTARGAVETPKAVEKNRYIVMLAPKRRLADCEGGLEQRLRFRKAADGPMQVGELV